MQQNSALKASPKITSIDMRRLLPIIVCCLLCTTLWAQRNLRIAPMAKKTFNSGVTLNFDARLSLTYDFERFFVNVYGQFNNNRYRHQSSHGHLNDWFINTAVGVRL